jgi:hypothetical protein
MAVLFSLCVGLQINDPDPVEWMAMYGAAAVSSAVLPARRWLAIGAAVTGLVAAAWGAYLLHQVLDVLEFSDLVMKMDEKGGAVEVGREAAGLGLVAGFMLGGAGFRAMRA